MVFNDSLLQTDESGEFRAHLDTAYIPALGETLKTPVTGKEVQALCLLLREVMTPENQANIY